jgi:hypothetical protein
VALLACEMLVTPSAAAHEAGFRHSVAVTEDLMAVIETIPSREAVQERLWDVLRMASLSARRAKPGCSGIAFEVMLPIEGKKYQTLILNIRPGDTPAPVVTIGFPADFRPAAQSGAASSDGPSDRLFTVGLVY